MNTQPSSIPSAEGGLVIIEQVGASECSTRNRPYLYAVDESKKRVLLFRPNCKMWKCAHCAEANRLQWVYKIKHGLEVYEGQGDKFWFATLTTHRKLRTHDAALAAWRNAWDKLYHRMKRFNPNPMHYVLLPELAPETGRLHAHMIVNCSFGATFSHTDKRGKDWYSCRWIKDNPAKCGLGYMNDIRPVNNAGLGAWYVSKYVGKTLDVPNWPEHFRRVRPSINWPEQPEIDEMVSGLEWVVVPSHKIESEAQKLWAKNYDIIDLNSGEIFEGIDL